MKKGLVTTLLISWFLGATAHPFQGSFHTFPGLYRPQDQNIIATATLKSSSRLFKEKDDLTSVIMIIPSGSTVSVIDSAGNYLHVLYQDSEGFIYRKQAVIDKSTTAGQPDQQVTEPQVTTDQPDSRYADLAKKYGDAMASRIYAGKIWKGMNSEMVSDSWGSPAKINRVISGNTLKEEWIYRSTWLYFENNTLVKWGPVKR